MKRLGNNTRGGDDISRVSVSDNQDKNVEQSYKTDVLIFIIRSVCESFFGNNETKTKFVNLIAISIFKLRNVGNRSSVGPLILIGETVIIT